SPLPVAAIRMSAQLHAGLGPALLRQLQTGLLDVQLLPVIVQLQAKLQLQVLDRRRRAWQAQLDHRRLQLPAEPVQAQLAPMAPELTAGDQAVDMQLFEQFTGQPVAPVIARQFGKEFDISAAPVTLRQAAAELQTDLLLVR